MQCFSVVLLQGLNSKPSQQLLLQLLCCMSMSPSLSGQGPFAETFLAVVVMILGQELVLHVCDFPYTSLCSAAAES